MSTPTKFDICGIRVKATHLGGGMYVGIPEDLGAALMAMLTGKVDLSNPTIVPVYDEAPAKTEPKRETISEYRARTGMSRTKTAEKLGISRRTLGRWESRGELMPQ